MATPEPNPTDVMAGIKLILAEIRDLRVDLNGFAHRADEDRKGANEDRNRADRRFEFLVETIREERKASDRQSRSLVRSVVQVGRRILDKLDEHTALLKGIHKGIQEGVNGRNGNGRSKR